ncbi:MAG: hypothetical protein IT426_20615 [Pirellulales bacterium]|nr:hypothetical protein [Pirellulales bacterium]
MDENGHFDCEKRETTNSTLPCEHVKGLSPWSLLSGHKLNNTNWLGQRIFSICDLLAVSACWIGIFKKVKYINLEVLRHAAFESRRTAKSRHEGDGAMFSGNRFSAKCVFSSKNGPVPGLCSSPANPLGGWRGKGMGPIHFPGVNAWGYIKGTHWLRLHRARLICRFPRYDFTFLMEATRMLLGKIFERFVEKSPVRAALDPPYIFTDTNLAP